MSTTNESTANTLARLEGMPFGPWHRKLIAVACVGVFFDAADFVMFGSALPVIAKEFGLNPQQAGLLATVGLAGAFVGALFWGTISDYIGRKTAFQATVAIFAVFTGLMALTWNALTMGIARFIANFGLGGEIPVTTTLVAEYMPRNVRGLGTGTVMAAFGVGQVAAALLGLLVIPTLGWKVLFLIGVVPIFLIWVIRRTIPESLRYLLNKGRTAEAARIIEQIETENGARADVASIAPISDQAAKTVTETAGFTVGELFRPDLRRRTTLLWIVSVGLFWAGNGMIFMLPLILTQRGMSIGNALTFSLIQAAAGVVGYMSITYLMDLFGRRLILPLFLILGAAFDIWFAYSSGPMMYVAMVAVGFCNPGVFGGCITYSAELYPTAVRATGVGWFFGIGRVGSFLVPFVLGTMMVSGYGMYVIHTFALAYFVAGLAIMAIAIETRGRVLDTINETERAGV
jgi:putative MFS transporter